MRPLEGMRVVDFGIITAGASTSASLADLGAEVVKVEGPTYLDPFRVWVGRGSGEEWWNDSPQFSFTNRGKFGLCVDLKSERGLDLVLDLVEQSDIVLENFRSGVLDRLGLGFDALKARNPSIVLASISSQGLTGPEADAVSFGSTLEASGGLSSMITAPDGRPLISGHALNYPDQAASLFATGAILSVIAAQRSHGAAIHLDISQRELAAFMIGEWFTTDLHPQTVDAQRGSEGVFACADGRLVAVNLEDRAADDVAATAAGLPMHDVTRRLRAKGIAAEPVLEAADVYARHAQSEGLAAFATDPAGNPVKGLPWHAGEGTFEVARAAPELGRDNAFVVRQILGRSAEEYDDLVAAGVLATGPRKK